MKIYTNTEALELLIPSEKNIFTFLKGNKFRVYHNQMQVEFENKWVNTVFCKDTFNNWHRLGVLI